MQFPVVIINDAINEVDETFTAVLSSPTGAIIGAASAATVTITDDDRKK